MYNDYGASDKNFRGRTFHGGNKDGYRHKDQHEQVDHETHTTDRGGKRRGGYGGYENK